MPMLIVDSATADDRERYAVALLHQAHILREEVADWAKGEGWSSIAPAKGFKLRELHEIEREEFGGCVEVDVGVLLEVIGALREAARMLRRMELVREAA